MDAHKTQPFVRIITINFDGGATTLRCLESLTKITYPESRFEIVVVDNASVDGLIWSIPTLFPRVKVIANLTNEGFARGNNGAMRDLHGVDYVALINNDTVVHPDWLTHLVARAESSDSIGAVSSKMLFKKLVRGVDFEPINGTCAITDVLINQRSVLGDVQFDERRKMEQPSRRRGRHEYWIDSRTSLWVPANEQTDGSHSMTLKVFADDDLNVMIHFGDRQQVIRLEGGDSEAHFEIPATSRVINNAGGGLFKGLYGGDVGFKELDFGQYETPREVFSFCGGSALLRTKMLREIGLFDDTYFLYYEDLDLSWRARFAGWKVHYEPKSIVLHEHAFSSVAGSHFFRFWVDRNRRLTLVKNAPTRDALLAVSGAVGLMLQDVTTEAFRSIRQGRLPLKFFSHRIRQLGSVIRALPKASRARWTARGQGQFRRQIVDEWIIDR